MTDFNVKVRQDWSAGDGELICLPPQEPSRLLAILNELAKSKPGLDATYKTVSDAANQTARAEIFVVRSAGFIYRQRAAIAQLRS